jgi:flagellar hook-length control protein FliK
MHSPHVDVRQALESSLPRLRELLGEQGFQLAHADVGHQAPGGDGNASGQPVAAASPVTENRRRATPACRPRS